MSTSVTYGSQALTLTPQWKLGTDTTNVDDSGYSTLYDMTFNEPATEIHAHVTYCVEALVAPGEVALSVDDIVVARCVAPVGASSGALSDGVLVDPGAHSVKVLWRAGAGGTIRCLPESEPHHVAMSVFTTNV